MSENNKKVVYRCPECFAKDIDMNLKEEDGNYYCTKCCFEGAEEVILSLYRAFQKNKYRGLEFSQNIH